MRATASLMLLLGVFIAPSWAIAQTDSRPPDAETAVEADVDDAVEGDEFPSAPGLWESAPRASDAEPGEAEPAPASEPAPTTAPRRAVPSEVAEVDRHVAATERSDLLTALGVLTVTAAVGAGLAFGVVGEREGTLGICQGYASAEPPRLGCLNVGEIEEQRDIALVFATSFAITAAGAAVAWIVAAIMGDEPPDPEASTCSASPLGIHCQGRF